MTEPLIEIRDLSFRYDEDPVVKNVSLKINRGEFVCVIGPNGSGKSTLLKLMAGILDAPKGSVFFQGKELHSHSRKQLARSIAWTPQEHMLAFSFSVSEVVLMGRHPHLPLFAFESERDLDIARDAMQTTQTLKFAERNYNEISGGEKQRVLLASAIAQEPELMALDEPTSALDIKYQVQILEILKRLNKEQNMTLILALHDLHLASKYCDRLILLDQGVVARDGTPEQVLEAEILEKVYDVPVKLYRDPQGGILVSPGTESGPAFEGPAPL
ncbi:MAG: ABC transporter ATP-binding protein [Candidatus Nitrohelix vancouverensis]|uniref:ABC transporter ATP-binding protein n=1 Tax=Candidatus Nitrohelix vancouverensis TaxID=2705534 RepID=A0A7T0C345_9BACT|nr:MAG: ABC transporter ATP-binding protein [Candidatus Nitrohelix vancouverensis]